MKRIGKIYHRGFWGTPYKAQAECSDGVMRMVQITGAADTFFSIPARLSFRKTTIAGFVSWHNDHDTDTQTLRFYPYKYRKNHNLLPEW